MTPAPALAATVALIHAAAATWHLDPLLVQAVVRIESDYDATCITGSDYGLMQVNAHTLAAMSGRWATTLPRALLQPEVGLQAGCLCLREYLVCAFADELGLQVEHRAAGAVLAAMAPEDRGPVLARALAYYNKGRRVQQSGAGRWANQPYVDAVLREYERLQGEGENGD